MRFTVERVKKIDLITQQFFTYLTGDFPQFLFWI